MSKWNELKARKLTMAQIGKVNCEVAAQLVRMDLREFRSTAGLAQNESVTEDRCSQK